MAAQDNLNEQQFMSVEKLGSYQSMDHPVLNMDQVSKKFGVMERVNPEFKAKMDDLRGQIQADGITRPLAIDSTGFTSDKGIPMLGNGHHRFHAAKSLGLSEVPVDEVL